jgi:hypothetical protein
MELKEFMAFPGSSWTSLDLVGWLPGRNQNQAEKACNLRSF